jgi:rubrerythrin
MNNKKQLTTLEILGVAIQAEIESARYYRSIQRAVQSHLLKDKMGFLSREEQKHRRILTDYHLRKFPGVSLSGPDASLAPKPIITLKGRVAVSDLLKAAMKAEENAERFYQSMASGLNDIQGGLLLKYLARVENSHYYLLKAELELIRQGSKLKALKILYQADENIHIGP